MSERLVLQPDIGPSVGGAILTILQAVLLLVLLHWYAIPGAAEVCTAVLVASPQAERFIVLAVLPQIHARRDGPVGSLVASLWQRIIQRWHSGWRQPLHGQHAGRPRVKLTADAVAPVGMRGLQRAAGHHVHGEWDRPSHSPAFFTCSMQSAVGAPPTRDCATTHCRPSWTARARAQAVCEPAPPVSTSVPHVTTDCGLPLRTHME